jgi:quercetin dioxygenase-like cupin family protein
MRFHRTLRLTEIALTLSTAACNAAPRSTPSSMAHLTPIVASTPEVLELDQGERFVRRGSSDSANVSILKVDGQNGGSANLVMGYERLAPGRTIAPHRHLLADEIIFVHEGSGIAEVGELKKSFGTGATIYIPKNVRVSVHNTGSVPLAIAFIFSTPGFDAYLRETSVPSGRPITPMSSEELTAIRARHGWHVVYEQP